MKEYERKKPVILCVDDEKIVLDALYRQLQRKFGDQYLYEFAESGEEALEVVNELRRQGSVLKIIIADQLMPGMKGDVLLARVHALDPACIKIVLTGQASLSSAINAINNAGIFRYITKPWDEQEFLDSVEKGLARFDLGEKISKIAPSSLTPSKITELVYEQIQKMLVNSGETSFDPKLPLMNLGFTSLDLLELRDRLKEIFNEELQATFFFQYNTAEAIANFLIQKILRRYYDWLYTIEYREARLPPMVPLHPNGLWIIFADENAIFSAPLAAQLVAESQQVITIPYPEQSKKPDSKFINKIFSDLARKDIEGIIYLWGWVPETPTPLELEFLQIKHRISCEGILFLLNALEGHLSQKQPQLWIINEIQEKIADPNALAEAPLAWLSTAIVTEHPELSCRRISFNKSNSIEENIQHCIATLKAQSREDQIVWMDDGIRVARLARLTLPESRAPVVLDPKATYVIIGGCDDIGGIGIELAKWQINCGSKKLLLINPQKVSIGAEKIIQDLRESGVDVNLEIIDVTNKKLLQDIFKKANSRAPIQGIIHALSIIDDDKLINYNWQRFEEMMQYKIPVSWYLHEIGAELSLELEHFILFSTIDSSLGSLWRGSRSSANGFLSALAHYRRELGLPALVIDWGPMISTTTAADPFYELMIPVGLKTIKVEQGIELLGELYHSPVPEIIAMDVEWEKFLTRFSSIRPFYADIESELGLRRSELLLQLQNQSTEIQEKLLEDYVKLHLRRILFKPPHVLIDTQIPLADLGMDNLRVDELRQNIQSDLGVNIALPKHLFQIKNTIKDLAKGLLEPVKNIKVDRRRAPAVSGVNLQEPIAIIGMDCRLPGARNYEEFWSNLLNRVDSINDVPPERWDWHSMRTKIHWGGFIQDIDKFDPLFFNISPKEAAYMDPQHRIFLESAWHAMEDAGYSSRILAGKKVGVYAGVSKNDYAELMREQGEEIKSFISIGTVHSILSNRVSYILDIHGPSESIDTACSSALVALYSAVRDIRMGACSYAFVGGVNALLSPTMFESHSLSGMLSEEGHCKTFDASADGYVRGEGVGVILIKPLSDAIKDGDSIYAVIRSVAVNHGGKSSGLTAPNINSQAEVIETALKEANVNPSTISYVEAHGTGTPLGDPIEIEGLKKGFAAASKQKLPDNYCAVGAVKTNIGHCESAAGISGLIKTVLALKNRVIPSNLYFQTLNPKIILENSPFFIAKDNQDWVSVDSEKNSIIRRAGVSSFGMGGANAHVILEEAPEILLEIKSGLQKMYFPISAKKGQLDDYVKKYEKYLRKIIQAEQYVDLESLAYTMQTGRDNFEDRVVFSANSLENLYEEIQLYLRGEKSTEVLIDDAAAWMKGATVSWDVHWSKRPQRLAGLPTYPFKQLRCWFESKPKKIPLDLDINLLSDAFYLRDHIIAGRSILPGVMYIELARSAAEKLFPDKSLVRMGSINWMSPIVAESEILKVHISFEGDKIFHFKITEKEILRCEGDLIYESNLNKDEPSDITQIIQNCPNKKSQSEIYELMQKQGLSQGASLRVITEFHSSPAMALAKLKLNPEQQLSEFKLHPSLMDGVFQTVVAHHFCEHQNSDQQYLPYALESLELFKPLEREVYAYVEELPESSQALLKYRMKMLSLDGEVIAKFSGFLRRPLHKEQPKIKVEKEIYYVEQWVDRKARDNRLLSEHLLLFSNDDALKNALSEKLPKTKIIQVGLGANFEKHGDEYYLVNPSSLGDFQKLIADLKERNILIDDLVYTWNMFDIAPIFLLIKAIMLGHCYQNLLFLYVYSAKEQLADAQYSMAAGFGRTLIFENPTMELRSIELDAISTEKRAEIIITELKSYDTSPMLEISYKNGFRQIREIISAYEIANFVPHKSIFRVEGKYLITGGLGGLGIIFAHYLATRYRANLILIGRSPVNPKIQASLDMLKKSAKSVHYLSVDVTDEQALQESFLTLPKSLHDLNGVIHAAGLKKDSFILKKEMDSLRQVITPKVKGALSLDALTKNMSLDFMVLFSSIAALIPNQGQSDYAAANSFLDRFAVMRNHLCRQGKRHGLTRSIAWPLWQSGGMQVTKEQEKHLKTEFGMDPLPTELGVPIFEHLLNYANEAQVQRDHIVVISGDKEKIVAAFQGRKFVKEEYDAVPEKKAEVILEPIPKSQQPESSKVNANEIIDFLKECIGVALNIDPKEISPDVDFVNYGITSNSIIEINTLLEKRYKGLPKTLMFEYLNLSELLNYFVNESANKAIAVAQAPEPASSKVNPEEVIDFLKECIGVALNIDPKEISPDVDFVNYGITSNSIIEINTLLEKRYKGLPKTLMFEYLNLSELLQYFIGEGANKAISADVSPASSQSPIQEKISASQKISAPLVDFFATKTEFPTAIKIFRKNLPYVNGFSHKENPAVPGACFLEMARQGAAVLSQDKNFISIVNNFWPAPLEIKTGEIQTQTRFISEQESIHFEITSNENQPILHASGTLLTKHTLPPPAKIDLNDKKLSASRILYKQEFYETIHKNADLRLSGLFQPVVEFFVLETEAIAMLRFPDSSAFDAKNFIIQPVIFTGIEQCLLVFTALTHAQFHPQGIRLMPVSIAVVDIYAAFPERGILHIEAKKNASAANKIQRFDATLYDENGKLIVFVSGNTMRINPLPA